METQKCSKPPTSISMYSHPQIDGTSIPIHSMVILCSIYLQMTIPIIYPLYIYICYEIYPVYTHYIHCTSNIPIKWSISNHQDPYKWRFPAMRVPPIIIHCTQQKTHSIPIKWSISTICSSGNVAQPQLEQLGLQPLGFVTGLNDIRVSLLRQLNRG